MTDSSPDTSAPLTWSLCIATYNRIDVLEKSISLALEQTRPPQEIVVADASPDWKANRERVAKQFSDAGPALVYLKPERPSLTHQRNLAIGAACGDILALFDDDTMMFPDCAQQIMSVYERDGEKVIAAVGAANQREMPEGVEVSAARKISGKAGSAKAGQNLGQRVRASSFGRWAWREVFLMSAAHQIVPYDGRPITRPMTDLSHLPDDLRPVPVLQGFSITVRRDVALKEPFEEALLAYCPAEDLDATYRFGRHGLLVIAPEGRIHHFEAAAGRIKRKRATALGLLNVAYFTRRHSDDLPRHRRAFYTLLSRRILAEFLKDTLSRRWAYPQFLGTLLAIRHAPQVFRVPDDRLRTWYMALQERILAS
ncbi:putative glycosyl hydrolase [Jannaschia seosinensis]|uniref:Putative glycosyl hydrolase n=1 Tax=Jannaschia seosinensis TaxID=313367 RepID=A0A0M7BA76_9RHOB|nr:glycosyltransferase family 2 protein [Jannaschia seosinensis]CUH38843.1 putative glycosyl hydrolase [Jannaschia seosinensis]